MKYLMNLHLMISWFSFSRCMDDLLRVYNPFASIIVILSLQKHYVQLIQVKASLVGFRPGLLAYTV